MSRSIAVANETASQAPVVAPVFFVKLQFDAANVCFHSRLGTITWGGDTYTGAGDIGGIGVVDEDAELSRSTLQLTLRGLPLGDGNTEGDESDIISAILNEHYQGRIASLYLGYLNLVTEQLVADPTLVYRGRMDTAGIEQGETLAVTLSVESRFAAWDRPRTRRYNHADQQTRFPGDKGLEFVEQTTEKQIVWGQAYAG